VRGGVRVERLELQPYGAGPDSSAACQVVHNRRCSPIRYSLLGLGYTSTSARGYAISKVGTLNFGVRNLLPLPILNGICWLRSSSFCLSKVNVGHNSLSSSAASRSRQDSQEEVDLIEVLPAADRRLRQSARAPMVRPTVDLNSEELSIILRS